MIGVLRRHVERTPDREVLAFLADGEEIQERLTFRDLDRRSRAVAAALAAECPPGGRALLLFHPGLEFAVAFLACLYAGVIAVPAYPPRSRRTLPRLRAITEDSRPAVVLTTGDALPRLRAWCETEPEVSGLPWLAVEEVASGLAEGWQPPDVAEDDIAFLQYTSGSTGSPKGVMVSHGNLLHNQRLIRAACGHGPDSVFVSWLPVYHDLGLIGQLLQAVHAGARCVLMAPVAFLQRPMRWLEAVSRFGATTSGGPNFAYDLCVEKSAGTDVEALDLSAWRVAFNGAEPVRAGTLRRFAERFAPSGFRSEAFYPCYGLAEATLMVSGGSRGEAPRVAAFERLGLEEGRAVEVASPAAGDAVRELVGCGRPLGGQAVEVVDPGTGEPRTGGRIGEVWIAGGSVALGYWGRPEVTEESFGGRLPGRPERFLRTGDLGFLLHGELYIAGRSKDLIILRGRNLHPQDLELTSESSHPGLRAGAAAFSVDDPRGERLVVVQEVERRPGAEPEEMAAAIRGAVALEHEAHVHDVVLVKPGRVPRTTSGKVQRSACRKLYLRGELDPVTVSTVAGEEAGAGGGEAFAASRGSLRRALESASGRDRASLVEELVRTTAARLLRTDSTRIDPDEPLAAYGLDSLAAVELQHVLEIELGVSTPLAELLDDASVGAIARRATALLVSPEPARLPPLEALGDPGPHPLSHGQRSLWFLHRLAPESAAYNIAGAARLPRSADPARLERAFRVLADRHEILRTRIVEEAEGPVQRVAELRASPMSRTDAAAWDAGELRRRMADEAVRPFDLAHDPPWRAVLYEGAGEAHLLLVVHHAAADFWSLAVLVRELGLAYGGGSLPAAPEVSYGDYARWQDRVVTGPHGERCWEHWRRRLTGAPVLELPTDRPRPPVESYRGGCRTVRLGREAMEAVRDAARRRETTPFSVLVAAFQALLSRVSGQDDFLVGTPTAGRPSPRLARTVGYFVNPVALRARLGDDPRGEDWLARARAGVAEALEHADLPFAVVAERLQPERDPGRHPLFQALFAFQRAPDPDLQGLAAFALGEPGERLSVGELTLESTALERRAAQLDLAVLAGEVRGGLVLAAEYNTDLFDGTTAERMARQLGVLLRELLAAPNTRVSELPLLAAAERHQVAVEWGLGAPVAPRGETLASLVRDQVRRSPEAVALEAGPVHWSYRGLAERGRTVAGALSAAGVGPGDRVGVLLPRSPGLVSALLGVLETGAAYVALDPELPPERTAAMIELAGPAVVLAARSTAGGLPPGVRRVLVEAIREPRRRRGAAAAEAGEPGPEGLAYVLFTSGSTGTPKPVAVPHRGVVNRILRAQELHRLGSGDAVLQKTPLGFDFSAWELFAPLSAGARVVLARPGGQRDPVYLARLLEERRVTLVHFVPSMWEAFLASAEPAARSLSLRQAFSGGEALTPALRDRILAALGVPLENQYGPTEASIDVLWHQVAPGEGGSSTVPLGRPIAGCEARILGPGLAPLPPGVAGELVLGGVCLGRGYPGKPGLTAERFVPRPGPDAPGERLYRTGDLARFRPAGEIDYLGRADRQVKLHGVRIEPGEVEAALSGCPGVREAAVVVQELAPGDRRLVAYTVGAEAAPAPAELREALAARLPAALVPSLFITLPELPRTPSGKLDRRALPRPEAGLREREAVAPRTPVEELLAEVWADLLGLEQVGARDHFFELGGHSLLATRVVSRLRSVLGVELPVAALFRHPVLADLAREVERTREDGGRPDAPPLVPTSLAGEVPPSFAQERLWFLDRLEPGSPVYNMPAAIRLEGDLDAEALRRAIEAVAERHEPLRTAFPEVAGAPVQAIAPPGPLSLPRIDLGRLPEARRESEARRVAERLALEPFDLGCGPLLRLALARLAPAVHVLYLTLHHAVADGWSLGVLARELGALYRAALSGDHPSLPELPVRYADYAVWQRAWLASGGLDPQLRWWRDELAGAPGVLELPTDRRRPPVQSLRGGARRLTLDRDLTAGLRALGRRLGTTPFMTLLALFQALLSRHVAGDRIPVGSPVANRSRVETEGLIGLFVNTLVLAPDLSGDPSFAELAGRVRDLVLAAHARQDVPFERLVEELAPERSLAHTPLFQVAFSLEYGPPPVPELSGLRAELLAPQGAVAKFDLTLTLEDRGGEIGGTLDYARDLFDAATVDRLAERLEVLAAGAVARPDSHLSELPVLSEVERRQLDVWSRGPRSSRPFRPVYLAVRTRAAAAPDRTALVGEGWSLTYGTLARRAGALAARLRREAGVGPGAVVAVFTGRSQDLAVAALAAHEAGAAYLPLDPAYPPEHLAYVLEDSGAAALVVARDLEAQLPTRKLPVVAMAAVERSPALPEPFDTPGAGPSLPVASDLAYLIYTSGSTGRPKGVEVSHGGLANLVAWHLDAYAPGPDDRSTLLAGPAFDASVWELWPALAAGACLEVPTDVVRADPRALLGWLAARRVTVSFLPTPLAEAVLDELEAGGEPAEFALAALLTGGDRLRRTPPAGLRLELINHYGPTESSVVTTAGTIGARDRTPPAIGRPIANLAVRVVDPALRRVPPGVPGELCVAGAGLARGYRGRAAPSAERFVPDPWSGEPGGRLYRTGDLVRQRLGGELLFLGRLDTQVKVRGFRVELGEIEAVLAEHPGVRAAVVATRPGAAAGARLVAYVVAAGAVAAPAEALREHLRARLPAHMIPDAWVELPTLPLTPNGKVDRDALPEPPASGDEAAAPRDPEEEVVAGVWADLLGLERVGIHQDFFDLGGHSLLATRVLARLRDALDVELSVADLFDHPTVASLAAAARAARRVRTGAQPPPLRPARRDPGRRSSPLSFAQERLWFLDQLEPGKAVYNVPAAVELRGRLDLRSLARSVSAIVARHEVLRTRVFAVAGEPAQEVLPPGPVPLPVVDLARVAEAAPAEVDRRLREEAGTPFDLGASTPLRLRLLRLGPGRHVLCAGFHHIAADGWSIGVFVRELAALYRAFLEGRPAELPELPVQYADYALWQRRALAGEALEAGLAWWRDHLAGAPEAIDLPLDRPRPTRRTYAGGQAAVRLPPELVRAADALGRRQGATRFMVLLAAFQALLARVTGQDDVVVGTPVANRGQVELEGLIGFFVNSLALRGDLAGDPAVETLLDRTRARVLGAFTRQDLPFETLVEALAPRRDLAHSPLFQVMLVLQNAPVPALALPGLEIAPLPDPARLTKLDLTLSLEEGVDGSLEGPLRYGRDLFDPTTVRRLADRFQCLLAGLVERPGARVSELPLLGRAERHALLHEWSATPSGPPETRSLFELLARRAAERPEAVALEGAEESLSYGELVRRSNALARRLAAAGAGPDRPVAVFLERSAELAVTLVAAARAGAPAVPLDPDYPTARVAFMLEDSAAAPVITTEALRGELPATGARVLLARLAGGGEEDGTPLLDPASPVLAAAPAYVLYTSGSTGRPSGVAVPQAAVAEHLRAMAEGLPLGPADTVLWKTPASFDPSVWELWAPLAAGARLAMARPGAHRDPEALTEAVGRHRASILRLVPTIFDAMLEGRGLDVQPSLRRLFVGGEELPPAAARRFLERSGAELVNSYGPTEATVTATFHRAGLGAADRPVPIGRPVGNLRAYVLDRALRPVTLGAAGELALAGPTLATGYRRRPGWTAGRFVPDPLGREPGGRLYRTGDLARHLPDGSLEFRGRIDDQVKVRGVRIEPAEVSATLRRHPEVREAFVTLRRPGGDRAAAALVAYVVPRKGAAAGAPRPADLRSYLETRLPRAMVPSAFVPLTALPLTPNGKVDRRALPEPDRDTGGMAPRTPVEEVVAGLWQDLLGLERVPVDRSFFELGGHSLLATRLVSRLRQVGGRELPLRAVFEHDTVAAQAGLLERAPDDGEVAGTPPELAAVPPAERPAEIPLSLSQERLWFLDRLSPGEATYNLPYVARLRGSLHAPALARALGEIVRRHEALRTAFPETAGRPRQRIDPPASLPLPVVDLAALSGGPREREARRLTRSGARRPFDPRRGPLVRAALLRAAPDEHVLHLDLHHLVSDAWSRRALAGELGALYGAFRLGEPSPLPALPLQYADFALWQRSHLRGAALDTLLGYWREALRPGEILELPTDRPRPSLPSTRGGWELLELPGDLLGAVRRAAGARGATPFMVLLAAFQALLGRHTGAGAVTVGTPVAGRARPEVEPLIGLFVNTLALRVELGDDPPFEALLERVRGAALEAYAHQDLPFERLVEELHPERRLDHTPLFQVMLAFQDRSLGELALPGLEVEPEDVGTGTAKFDLTLSLIEEEGRARGVLEYRRDLFDPTTVRRLGMHFLILLEGALAEPRARLSELPLLSRPERWQLVGEWNDAESPAPPGGALHELVAERAAEAPEAVAVVRGELQLTFGAIDRRARRLAGRLRRVGFRPGAPVGVLLEPSVDLVVALLAVWRAGGAYLPLDPVLPRARLDHMLTDSGAAALLSRESLRASWPEGGTPILAVDGPGGADDVDRPPGAPGDLAWIVYTSGSTGTPKGVEVGHRAAARHLAAVARLWGLGPEDRVAQSASPSFDLWFEDVLPALLAGGTVVLPGDGGWEAPRLDRDLSRQRMSVFNPPTALFHEWMRNAGAPSSPGSLRLVMVGGEAMSSEAVRRWAESRPGVALLNAYGPTEAVVTATVHAVNPGASPAWANVPIGAPLAHRTAHVLDRAGRPVAVGVAGELCVGGELLARGYRGDSRRTAERFVPDPWGAPGSRLYRTGDRVRRRRAGALEFLGRLDRQVKVRGFRVEAGEVEAALLHHPEVGEAAVVLRRSPSGEPTLVAYAVAAPGGELTRADLRRHLEARLPGYMVPGAFVLLDALPRTPVGKLDQAALPAPESGAGRAAGAEAPRGPVEALVAAAWEEVLGTRGVGREADFFDLGGHSLLATRVVARLRDALGVELPVAALFRAPTVARLAAAVEEARSGGAGADLPPLVPVPRGSRLPLSFAQERLWFIDRLEPGAAAYSIPAVIRLAGRLDAAALHRALADLVRRHEALRTTFREVDGEPAQVVARPSPYPLARADLSGVPAAARERETRALATAAVGRPFALDRGPLLRCLLLRLGAEDHVLVVVQHHIVSDGWSMEVFVRELGAAYEARLLGRPPSLPELPVQYADFAAWQRRWLDGPVLEAEIAWWRGRLEGVPPVLELPADRPRPAVQSFRGRTLPARLPAGLGEGLALLCRRHGVTPFMATLAVFQAVLSRYSGRRKLTVGTAIANRTRTETEGLIGLFANTLALPADLEDDPPFRDLLARVLEVTLEAYAHQHLPFERLVETLQPARSLAHPPLVQVMLSVGDAPEPVLRLPGLAVERVHLEGRTAKFDLHLHLDALGSSGGEPSLTGAVEYATDLFDRTTVERLVRHLASALAAVMEDPGRRLSELPLLGTAESHQLLREWSGATPSRPLEPSNGGLGEAFRARTEEAPDRVALVAGDESVSYGELRRRVVCLADRLRVLGVGPEVRVGVCLERSIRMVTGILAVIEAGGAYVPLDAEYPEERLAFMIEDAGIGVLLTEEASRGALPTATLESRQAVVHLDRDFDEGHGGAPVAAAPWGAPGPDALAYVMYTSGSTGRPKGVAVPHRGVSRLVETADYADLGADDVFLQLAPISFDASTFEIWGPLANGGRLALPAERTPSLSDIADTVARHRVTVLWLTAGLYHQMAEERLADLAPVRQLLAGGDVLSPRWVRQTLETLPETVLINGYGPTENTTFTCCHRMTGLRPDPEAPVPLGRPIAGTRVYLSDPGLRPAPLGVPGELVTGGDGLARGYVGRAALTAERFVPDPFGLPGGRLYRTGDLARLLPSGRIDFLGRIDQQVKVRGFRVEPAEVEAALQDHPAVADAIVVARDDLPGGRSLVGYAVPEAGSGSAGPSPEALRQHLRARLPAHMVPAFLVLLPDLPLDPNGKVDRRALPAPGGGRAGAAVEYEPPRNGVEEFLAALWSELLRVERVGVHDDFFDLGGHSLLGLRVLSQVRRRFGVDVPVRRLFESPTVAGLTLAIARELLAKAEEGMAEETLREVSLGEQSDRSAEG